ncbi:MAG: BlaI/MecI/CopY family transcriptional regulator [Planctomycetota bacterium]|nr:BlaI/MecI/CopY family transcriptional regulator [Planctomycetota bacterium]
MSQVVPTERELQALKILWDRGEATVREVCEALDQRGEQLAYTTVLSLMQVMEQKGLVSHRAHGKTYVYLPSVEREATVTHLTRGFLDSVFDGAMEEFLVHAMSNHKISSTELNRLETLIEQARSRGRSKKGGES